MSARAIPPLSPRAASAPTVVVYRQRLLARSETFIAAQVRALRRWSAVLAGEEAAGELEGEGLPLCWLWSESPTASERLARRFLGVRRLAYAPGTRRMGDVRLVHAHFGCDGVDALALAAGLGVPLLVTLHGYDIMTHESEWRRRGERWARAYPDRLRRLAASKRSHFVAVSDAIRLRALEWGIREERIKVLPTGIDTHFFRPGPRPLAERAHRVLFIGRLVEKKGVAVLLDAMARLDPPAELVIGGDGPLDGLLRAQTYALGLSDRVQFRGPLDASQVRAELDEARLLCLPSVRAGNGDAEGFGQVLLEAQSAGVPVLTSAHAARGTALVEGVTGLFFPEHDAATLAFHIEALLGDETRLEAMGDSARRWVRKHYDIADTTATLEAHYDGLVAAGSPSQEGA